MSVTVKVEVPEGAFSALRTSPGDFPGELMRAAVVKWYELGIVSQSKSAEILGVSRAEFLQILSTYQVSPFQNDDDDLAAQVARG